jgi:hypothetical protein
MFLKLTCAVEGTVFLINSNEILTISNEDDGAEIEGKHKSIFVEETIEEIWQQIEAVQSPKPINCGVDTTGKFLEALWGITPATSVVNEPHPPIK